MVECGGGEVAVMRKPAPRCYHPLDAPPDYLVDLYAQTFLPGTSLALPASYATDLPGRLQGWRSVDWIWHEESAFFGLPPYRRMLNRSLPLASSSGATERAAAQRLDRLRLGFLPATGYVREQEALIKSLRLR